MRGGGFAGGTLQVLLEAKVEGLADGADDVLGQAIGALQDVTRWQGFKKTKQKTKLWWAGCIWDAVWEPTL